MDYGSSNQGWIWQTGQRAHQPHTKPHWSHSIRTCAHQYIFVCVAKVCAQSTPPPVRRPGSKSRRRDGRSGSWWTPGDDAQPRQPRRPADRVPHTVHPDGRAALKRRAGCKQLCLPDLSMLRGCAEPVRFIHGLAAVWSHLMHQRCPQY